MELKKSQGREADYSVIDNESILKKYGIIIPDLPSIDNSLDAAAASATAIAEEETKTASNQYEGDEETKHLLRAQESD